MNTAPTLAAPQMKCLKLILAGTVAATMTACSGSKPPVIVSKPIGAVVRPAALQHVVSQPAPVVQKTPVPVAVKPPAAKLMVYRSRDYGVSFSYPWQYRFVSAKAIAGSEASAQSDQDENWFTLAQVQIPKGFFPDTDFEKGYFTLRLNQELSEQECAGSLNAPDGKEASKTINGVDYRWMESDSGGRGRALKLRRYVTFTNGTCDQLEMGVKTSNADGLARELDPEQVMARLESMLRTVKVQPAMEDAAPAAIESTATTSSQN